MVLVNNLFWEICCCFSSVSIENLALSQSMTNSQNKWSDQIGGQFVHYKQMWPGTKKQNSLLLHCSDCFVFPIIPLMHEYFLIVKNFWSTEVLSKPGSMLLLLSFPGWYHCQQSNIHPFVPSHAFTCLPPPWLKDFSGVSYSFYMSNVVFHSPLPFWWAFQCFQLYINIQWSYEQF